MRTLLILSILWRLCVTAATAQTPTADVLVYGATPGGIAAAVAAAKRGKTVTLVEPTRHIGGMITSGLSHTDFHSFESLTGAFLDFSRRVEAHYAKEYGPESPQVKDSFRGTFGEPKVNLLVLDKLLAEHPNITVLKRLLLASAKVQRARTDPMGRLVSASFVQADGSTVTLEARVFVDGSYEGDLMAAAGVPSGVGREGRDVYGESLAPEMSDEQLQAYNFRFIATRDPANRVTPVAPRGYRREDFLGVLDALASGKIQSVFGYPRGCIFKAQTPPLPNGKYDINDVSGGLVRLSLPGRNIAWTEGDFVARSVIYASHLRDNAGLLYFLQNDEAVPAKFRDEAREWGWCRDEFTDTAHLPPQLYVRESRRMNGVHVYKQQDSEGLPRDARAVLHRDSIAMGDYGNNCHGTAHEGPRFGGKHTGEFYNPVPPYQVPYGVLLPREVSNLLVPVAVSASHVGYCALRLEPIWMSLGQAAGHAAALAVERSLPVQQVNVAELQHRLVADRSALIYVSDVLPGHRDFAAVQWWGVAGGLHGLEPKPASPRGKNIHGQYYEAAPGHAAQLDRPLDLVLASLWRALAWKLELNLDRLPVPDGRVTRGDFIRAASAQR
jgi:hypothetical protein